MLVPVLCAVGSSVVIAQPRGTAFVDACVAANGAYELDVVRPDGSTQTETVHVDGSFVLHSASTSFLSSLLVRVAHKSTVLWCGCAAVGSLGTATGRAAFMALPAKLAGLKYIGFAVTEAGVAKDSQAIQNLAEFLFECFRAIPSASFVASCVCHTHMR